MRGDRHPQQQLRWFSAHDIYVRVAHAALGQAWATGEQPEATRSVLRRPLEMHSPGQRPRRSVSVVGVLLLLPPHCLYAQCPPRILECTDDELRPRPGLTPRLQDCGLFNGSRCCGDVNNPCPDRCSVTRLVIPSSGQLGSGPGSCGAVVDELQHGQSCSFECADGYVPRGQQPQCAHGVITAGVVCQARACQLAPAAHAVLATHTHDNTGRPPADDACEAVLQHGDRCTFRCEPGYHFIGRRMECMYGAQVQSHPGRCVADVCTGLNPPINGYMGACPADGTLADGKSCELACADGYHMMVLQHPRCTNGELHANVECKDGPEYEQPIWGPLFLGIFFGMLIVLILYLGCTYIQERTKAVQMQPLQSGYELENMDGSGRWPSLFARGSKPQPVETAAEPVWGGTTAWSVSDKP